MNAKQLRAIWSGVVVAVLMMLVPPWKSDQDFNGYRFLFNPDLFNRKGYSYGHVDAMLLLVQWVLVGVVTWAATLAFKHAGHVAQPHSSIGRPRRVRGMVFGVIIFIASASSAAWRVYEGEILRVRREVLSHLVLDNVSWGSFGGYPPTTIDVQLYNPTLYAYDGPVIWHVHVYDPALKTHFDRVYRQHLEVSSQQHGKGTVDIGLAFDPQLTPTVSIVPP